MFQSGAILTCLNVSDYTEHICGVKRISDLKGAMEQIGII